LSLSILSALYGHARVAGTFAYFARPDKRIIHPGLAPQKSGFQLDFGRRKHESSPLQLSYEEIEIQKAVEKASNSGCPGLL
jgi:hypothetical protein